MKLPNQIVIRRGFRFVLPMLLLVLSSYASSALSGETASALSALRIVADIDSTLPSSMGDIHSDDGAVVLFDLVSSSATSSNPLGSLDQAEIDGFHYLGDGCGDSLYSLDIAAVIGGTAMRASDVFTEFGSKILDADVVGIPSGINIDAVSREPISCDLLLSIDGTAVLDGNAFKPDDVIRWNSNTGFSLYFATGFNTNVDALHYLSPTRMLASVDVTGALSMLDIMDEEVLEIATVGAGFQAIAFEPVPFNSSWQGADLNALWAQPAALVGTVQWQAESVTVFESAGTVVLTIERVGGSAGPITVGWSTQNATATAGTDYIFDFDNLAIADGVTSGQVTIVLPDDGQVEGSEYFNVLITGATGGANIGSPAIIRVNLLDDEDYIFAGGFE